MKFFLLINVLFIILGSLTILNEKLYFSVFETSFTEELWKYDDINNGVSSRIQTNLVYILFF